MLNYSSNNKKYHNLINKYNKYDTTSQICSPINTIIHKILTSSTLMTILKKISKITYKHPFNYKPSNKSHSTICPSQPPWNPSPPASPKVYKTKSNST